MRVAYLLLALVIACASDGSHLSRTASVCEVIAHPEHFIGTRLRIAAQGATDYLHYTGITDAHCPDEVLLFADSTDTPGLAQFSAALWEARISGGRVLATVIGVGERRPGRPGIVLNAERFDRIRIER
jgi:hypothetical protein